MQGFDVRQLFANLNDINPSYAIELDLESSRLAQETHRAVAFGEPGITTEPAGRPGRGVHIEKTSWADQVGAKSSDTTW